MVHADPQMSILEIGRPSADRAVSVLTKVKDRELGTFRGVKYVFAAPDTASVKEAEDLLKTHNGRKRFEQIDFNVMSAKLGQALGTFDLIVISDIFALIETEEQAISALKLMLKPKGKICFARSSRHNEKMVEILRLAKIWDHVDLADNCSNDPSTFPLAFCDASTMESLLRENDLSLDFTTESQNEGLHMAVASAGTRAEQDVVHSKVFLLTEPRPSKAAKEFASHLRASLEKESVEVLNLTWGSQQVPDSFDCISLMELENSKLTNLDEEDFSFLQKVLARSTDMLWVTGFDGPASALATGMFRTLRNESAGSQYRTLALNVNELDVPRHSNIVSRIAKNQSKDDEFIMEDGAVKISRFVDDSPLIERMSARLQAQNEDIETVPLSRVPPGQRLAIKTQGMLDTLCLEADESLNTELGSDEVEIQVKASGLK